MLNKRKQEYLIMPVFDFSNDTSEIKEEVEDSIEENIQEGDL